MNQRVLFLARVSAQDGISDTSVAAVLLVWDDAAKAALRKAQTALKAATDAMDRVNRVEGDDPFFRYLDVIPDAWEEKLYEAADDGHEGWIAVPDVSDADLARLYAENETQIVGSTFSLSFDLLEGRAYPKHEDTVVTPAIDFAEGWLLLDGAAP